MIINATLINLYHVCKRECWLHANGVTMEHTSDTVYDGKLLHENSYPQRNEKHSEMELTAIIDNIELSGKIDFFDAKEKIIHETKRSDKVEEAHEWQVKYYIWLLELNNINGAHATLEYPILRHKSMVELTQSDREHLQKTVEHIINLIQDDNCPSKINAKICKTCSYYELCYIEET
ncbi:MAG TPA: CRISPR-associated protein Cas4 [Hanamia sp.]|nr:CRISPR-associated protein Cas4 [Hanamia sp.]